MNKKLVFPILWSLLAIAWPARSQTMAMALEQAWSRHPLALASGLRQSEIQARAEMADGLTPGPASVSLATVGDQATANRGKQEWEVELETPLWLPGQRHARQAEATAIQKELDAQQLALRLQLAGEVREVWWAVAVARSKHALAAARHQAAQVLASDMERRLRAGELARVDANLAQVEQLSAQAELDEAQSTLEQAEQDFHLLTGAMPPDPLPAETLPTEEPSLDTHPQVLAAAASREVAGAKLALTQQSPREAPTLAVRLVRERADFSDVFADALGIKLTIPFSMGARVRQEVAGHRAEMLQAETEYTQVQRRMASAKDTAQRLMKAAQHQLEVAKKRASLTQDNLALVEKSFSLGESDLPALLRARMADFDAQALLRRQQISGHAALSRVNQSLGVLP
ncbi:MAG: TolC family protein [Rhodoferax sp.]|nr:TolC family protein [Rhodoferax sp.]MDP3653551.1 TolC family protein [Rhodoferax sp.]